MSEKQIFKTYNKKNVEDESLHLDPLDLARCSSSEARELVAYETAIKFNILPIGIVKVTGRKLLTVASAMLDQSALSRTLKFITDLETRIIKVDANILAQATYAAYQGSDKNLQSKINNLRKKDLTPFLLNSSEIPQKKSLINEKAVGEIPEFLESLVAYAMSRRASDIHIAPKSDGTYVTLRIDGSLLTHDKAICSLQYHQRLISRIKVLANLDISTKTKALDGNFSISLHQQELHLRTSIIPTIHGEKAVLRLHGCQRISKTEDLGFDEKTLYFVDSVIKQDNGTILCVGATGSGKTTTLYSLAQKVSHSGKNIICIEDPVEAHLPFATQISVNERHGLTFAHSLRSVLRQDPDCILIGELRDEDSASIALQASVTGHLVLSSLHASSVQTTFSRLKALGVSFEAIIDACSLIICQKLIPKLCSKCKVIDLTLSNNYRATIYRAVGCSMCDYSGFTGRVLVCESLLIDDKTRQEALTQKNETIHFLYKEENYVSFLETERKLLENGLITEERK